MNTQRSLSAATGWGALIGMLGGLIGLGGAEFRLPVLISMFRFAALEAVVLNKAMSLVVVTTALPFRAGVVSLAEVATHWPVIVNLLAGSLFGAWAGADWATRLNTVRLHRTMAVLLVLIAAVLLLGHDGTSSTEPALTGVGLVVTGMLAGLGIGVIAALLGVAGGELLIPTLVLLFSVDVKLAGSLSLAVSLPTMLVAFVRYGRDRSFAVLAANRIFVAAMATGSLAGTFVGGQLLSLVPSAVLLPFLTALLVISAVKVWRHE